jgi:hypothetical protein
MRSFAAVTFLSAFLLFLVQPLFARAVLPWFGGAPSVWTTSLLFYQTVLLAGYGYGHWSARLGLRRQAALTLLLLATTLLLLPITPSEAWKPESSQAPTLQLLGLLTVSVGGPYLMLASTAPLLHDWFARTAPGRSPYRLYAVSNIGSLLALVAYPVAVEPLLGVRLQGLAWSVAYAAFVVALGTIAWHVHRGATDSESALAMGAPSGRLPSARDIAVWVAFAACGSGLLLAITNHITMDIASVPLLWVLPLGLYLVTYVLAFAGRYRRETWGALLILALLAMSLLWRGGFALPITVQIGVGSLTLFITCMVCHGELARSAPDPRHLTGFYLSMAAGGALGGLSVAVLAPLVFSDFVELPVFLLASYLVLLLAIFRDRESSLAGGRVRIAWAVLALVFVGLLSAYVAPGLRASGTTVETARSFFGVLRVEDRPPGLMREMRVLRHGRIFHGAQFLDPDRRGGPTAYFSAGSGVARAITEHPRRLAGQRLRIGVIGLGVGTLASWGEEGDEILFYELDPDAERLARRHFTFLEESSAAVTVSIGDGRLALERDLSGGSPRFDVLVVDAFSGDAVPVHLLTREAMSVYTEGLRASGVLVFQITNRHLDLERVVRGLATDAGLRAVRVDQEAGQTEGRLASSWMIVGAPQSHVLLERESVRARSESVLWTDDFSNLLGVLR